MKKLFTASVLLALMVLAVPVMADYTGSLGPTTGVTYDTVAVGWKDKATLSWDVSLLASGPWAGFWQYDYTFSLASGWNGGISTLYLETSKTFTGANLKDWWGDATSVEIKTWNPNNGNQLPGEVYGIQFNAPWSTATEGQAVSYNLFFITGRDPVWGDFFVKDGNGQGAGGYVFNSGYLANDPTAAPSNGSLDYHILVPDTTDNELRTPELSTWLLLSLSGLAGGIVTIRRRRK